VFDSEVVIVSLFSLLFVSLRFMFCVLVFLSCLLLYMSLCYICGLVHAFVVIVVYQL
jgi:hypothetical protein